MFFCVFVTIPLIATRKNINAIIDIVQLWILKPDGWVRVAFISREAESHQNYSTKLWQWFWYFIWHIRPIYSVVYLFYVPLEVLALPPSSTVIVYVCELCVFPKSVIYLKNAAFCFQHFSNSNNQYFKVNKYRKK